MKALGHSHFPDTHTALLLCATHAHGTAECRVGGYFINFIKANASLSRVLLCSTVQLRLTILTTKLGSGSATQTHKRDPLMAAPCGGAQEAGGILKQGSLNKENFCPNSSQRLEMVHTGMNVLKRFIFFPPGPQLPYVLS